MQGTSSLALDALKVFELDWLITAEALVRIGVALHSSILNKLT